MIDRGAHTRPDPDADALDPDTRSMLRALLLCDLIEQIDRAAASRATRVASRSEPTSTGRASALDAMLEIRRALDRLDDGTYGRCEGCSARISLPELRAQPKRRLCIACRPKAFAPRRFLCQLRSLTER